MYLTWYGQSSFKLQDQNVTVLLDPYSARQTGLRGPNFKADIIILSDKETANQAPKDIKEGFIVDGPGEYDIKNVAVTGFKNKENKILYQIEIDGVRIGYLGEVGKQLKEDEFDKFNNIDVLILPIGNHKKVLSVEDAAEIIRNLEPSIVIPSCYEVPGLKIQLDPLNKFFKEMGVKSVEAVDKIRVVKKDLPEEMEVAVLKNI